MPNNAPLTTEQKATAKKLRSDGLSYLKIAREVGCSESGIYVFLTNRKRSPKKPKLIPAIPQQKPKLLLPRELHHGSCPTHRRSVSLETLQNLPQLTKPEIYAMLNLAVRNTC
jgi:hypothetical protein